LEEWRMAERIPPMPLRSTPEPRMARRVRPLSGDGMPDPLSGLMSRRPRLRVMIAEDNGWLLEGMADILSFRGAAVRKVADPGDILRMLSGFRPHVLVLADWFARKRVGLEAVIPDVASRFPGVRVIVTVVDPSHGAPGVREARVWGAAGILPKDSVLAGDWLRRAVADAVQRGL